MAEVAFLAQVFHWPLATLLDLEHPDRRAFIEMVSDIPGSDEAFGEP